MKKSCAHHMQVCIIALREREREGLYSTVMAQLFSTTLFLLAAVVTFSAGLRSMDFLYCSRQAGCQGPSIVN